MIRKRYKDKKNLQVAKERLEKREFSICDFLRDLGITEIKEVNQIIPEIYNIDLDLKKSLCFLIIKRQMKTNDFKSPVQIINASMFNMRDVMLFWKILNNGGYINKKDVEPLYKGAFLPQAISKLSGDIFVDPKKEEIFIHEYCLSGRRKILILNYDFYRDAQNER